MPISIFADFENGSLGSWQEENGVVSIQPAGGVDNPWFYFLISFVEGRTVEFKVPTLADQGGWPFSVSYDRTDWVPADYCGPKAGFRHYFQADDAIISLTPPYTNGMFYDFTLWAKRSPHADIRYLSNIKPPGSEPLTCITVSQMGELANKPAVWLVAREHPAEAAASWLAEGVVRYLLSPAPSARALREQFVFHIIPLLDIMGVHSDPARNALGWDDGEDSMTALVKQEIINEQQNGEVALIANIRSLWQGCDDRITLVKSPQQYFERMSAATTLPWFSIKTGMPKSSAFAAMAAEVCPQAVVAEIQTSWFYNQASMGATHDIRKSQYDLLQEGELLAHTLSATLGVTPTPMLPALLAPRLVSNEQSARVTVLCSQPDAQIFVAGHAYQQEMRPVGVQGSYSQYEVEIPFTQVELVQYITLKSGSEERRIILAERRNRPSDSSLL